MRKRKVIILSNIEWDFIWQRHQTLSTLLSRDYEVVFVEIPGIRKLVAGDFPRIWRRFKEVLFPRRQGSAPETHVQVLKPLILPATNKLFIKINKHIIHYYIRNWQAKEWDVAFLVVYSLTRTCLDFIQLLPYDLMIYDCVDNFMKIKTVLKDLPGNERKILGQADITLVSSSELFHEKEKYAKNIFKLPHGVSIEKFQVEKKKKPSKIKTVLYYGHIHEQHLDVDLVNYLARQRPDWNIVLIGPVKTQYNFAPNVKLLGQMVHSELATFLRRCEVIIIPYALNDYTNSVFPAKIYECLATGLPIVATPIKELATGFADYISLAGSPPEFLMAVERAFSADTPEDRDKRIRIAQENTWEMRYRQMKEIIAGHSSTMQRE